MIVLIAGVLGINPSLYESAEIDGASAVQSFFRITIPCLRTIILYVLVTSMIGGLQMFDIPYLLVTNSGPDNATMTTSVFIYRQAFRGRYLYNRAAAASVIMALIAAILSGVLFFILRDKDAARLKKEERMRRKQQRLEQKNLAPKGGQ
jgi:multiple sugar transport system permease protein